VPKPAHTTLKRDIGLPSASRGFGRSDRAAFPVVRRHGRATKSSAVALFDVALSHRSDDTWAVRAPDPIPALKEQLARELVARLDGWSQDYAGSFMRTHGCRVSNLRNDRLDCFSLQRLIRFVARTRGTVTMTVSWTPHFLYLPRAGPPRTPRPGATPATTR
jgi:hypothetical protein